VLVGIHPQDADSHRIDIGSSRYGQARGEGERSGHEGHEADASRHRHHPTFTVRDGVWL
jgi:hypothetical protein